MASRKKIAAVITEYRVPAHADVIVGKFIKGFPTDDGLIEPQVDIVSMYLDQIPDNDIGLQVSEEYDIPIYQSIRAALDASIEEALVLSFGGIESYGYHGLEALQCMIERRSGGEAGLAAVQCLEGEAVWRAGADGLWSRELAEAAAAAGKTASGSMEESCDNPAAFLLEFRDGFKATLLQLNGYAKEWSYAARGDGQILATGLRTHGPPYPHFSYLGLNIEAMFLSGEPQYPVERTLLVSGALDALMDSRHRGHIRLETPHLDVAYRSYETMPIRPTGPLPKGASTVPFDRI